MVREKHAQSLSVRHSAHVYRLHHGTYFDQQRAHGHAEALVHRVLEIPDVCHADGPYPRYGPRPGNRAGYKSSFEKAGEDTQVRGASRADDNLYRHDTDLSP